jgi:hypothetical protein
MSNPFDFFREGSMMLSIGILREDTESFGKDDTKISIPEKLESDADESMCTNVEFQFYRIFN